MCACLPEHTHMQLIAAVLYFQNNLNYTFPACSLDEDGKPIGVRITETEEMRVYVISFIHSANSY